MRKAPSPPNTSGGRRRAGNETDNNNNNTNNSNTIVLEPAPEGPKSSAVKFSVVEIREFERVVGDNPSCSSGVPVAIGWNHGKTFTMNLDDFERARPPRREQLNLVLTRGERHRLLVEWGASGQEVIESIRMIIRIKNQRRQTVNNLGSYDRIEEVIENVMRGAKRVICQSSSGTATRKLQEEFDRAATLRKIQKGTSEVTAATATSTTHLNHVSRKPPVARRNNSPSAPLSSNAANSLAGKHSSRETEPPSEVSTFYHSESGSNSEMGDMATPENRIPKPREVERPVVHVELDDIDNVVSKEENGSHHGGQFLDDDVTDDMSNPQSDGHRKNGRRAPLAVDA